MEHREDDLRLNVVVDADRFDAVVHALEAAGAVVDETWLETGSLSLWVARERLAAVNGVDGVLAVEPERTYQLPPPDSDLQ